MLNKKAFAEKIGVAQHTVTRWERNQNEPEAEKIDCLVRELGFPREFFFGSDIEEPDTTFVSFRSQTAMTAAYREAALAAGSIGFLVSDWVESKFDLPPVNVPDLHLLEPESAAKALRDEWALGERPISNMIQLLESKGVRVFGLAENTVTVNAYSLWRDNKPYVFLNTYKTAESSRFDAAHELAHLTLHQDGKTKGREAEDQAHRFAAAFLMPRSDVLATIPVVTHLRQLMSAKSRWRVSVAALNYWVHKLGITSDWKYRDLCVEISSKGYRTAEPLGIPRESSVVWYKVIQTLWAEKTTHADIARQLAIPESELDGLLFGILQSDTQALDPADRKSIAVLDDERCENSNTDCLSVPPSRPEQA